MKLFLSKLPQKAVPPPRWGRLGGGDSAKQIKAGGITPTPTLPHRGGWRIALILLPLLLGGCGFHPVYATHHNDDGTPVSEALNNVAIDNIKDRNGQILRNDLIDRMYGKGRSDQPLYTLKAKLRFTEQDLGILENATSTRELMDSYADYSLVDAQNREILQGTAHSVASFDRLDQMYGTVAAREDAYQRTIHELSEQIVNRLSLYFSEQR